MYNIFNITDVTGISIYRVYILHKVGFFLYSVSDNKTNSHPKICFCSFWQTNYAKILQMFWLKQPWLMFRSWVICSSADPEYFSPPSELWSCSPTSASLFFFPPPSTRGFSIYLLSDCRSSWTLSSSSSKRCRHEAGPLSSDMLPPPQPPAAAADPLCSSHLLLQSSRPEPGNHGSAGENPQRPPNRESISPFYYQSCPCRRFVC